MKIDIDIFDIASIENAISLVKDYAKKYEDNVVESKKRVADKCLQYATANMGSSWVDDIITTGKESDYAFPRHAPVVFCSVSENENEVVLTASGYDAVWVEFGAGVHYNAPAGDSPHEWGADLGMLIGEYGMGQGKYDSWLSPYGVSRGTEAQMPLYNACIQTEEDAYDIIKEVFKDD